MENQINDRTNHKVLVVYYSKTGHTRKIAQDIAKQLDADLEEISDQKTRTGLVGFVLGGRDALTGKETSISEMEKNPAEYDLVIFGSPIWAGNITPAIRTYINQYGDSIRSAAFFFSSGGKTPDQVFEKILSFLKEKPVAVTGLSLGDIKDKSIYKIKISLFIHSIIKEEL
ncbi:MAG: flavodoxin family protein [Elusimicrobiota bacterium]